MAHPLVYEINTRPWLRTLSVAEGVPVTLSSVPRSQFKSWQQLGFTHIWLMGVWSSGPLARARALTEPHQLEAYSYAFSDWAPDDVAGSPYAIADYQVPPALGGETGLRDFRRQLSDYRLKLVLDFVPNHLGLDHAWIAERPDLFVQSAAAAPETFPQKIGARSAWLAHGKDPNFAPWTDTAQLDYRLPATHAAMTTLLRTVADRCDGVRCDMAMLLLADVFAQTWRLFPVLKDQRNSGPDGAASGKEHLGDTGEPPDSLEFWPAAIQAIKQAHPEFVFLAEAYWGLEARLQSLGFDYTYDKELYDRLIARDAPGVQRHLLSKSPSFLASSAHFLENHDERRVASILTPPEQRAAAAVVLGLPGMRLLHDGQLSGAVRKLPVQLLRRAPEAINSDIETIYLELLTALGRSQVGRGEARLLAPRAAWAENPTAENFILIQWRTDPSQLELMAVNLAVHPSQCYAMLALGNLESEQWLLKDLLSEQSYARSRESLQSQGLFLDLPAHGVQLLRFEPAPAPS